MKKKNFILFYTLFLVILIISFVSAEIITISSNIVNPGDNITLTIRPTKSGFYNIIYVHKNTSVVDLINVPCTTICTRRQTLIYNIPSNFVGGYYFATFDYAINNYELDFFNVIESGGANQGALTLDYIGNVIFGTNGIINPEQGKNANINISVSLKDKKCNTYNVNAYLCNSSLLTSCTLDNYTLNIPLSFESKSGTVCKFSYRGEDFFPFYQSASDWQIFVRTGILEDRDNFVYTSLSALNYTSFINFGRLNTQQWNIGIPSSGIDLLNFGNIPLSIEWSSERFSCITENCTDFFLVYNKTINESYFQVDDDNLFMEGSIVGDNETETGLNPIFITNATLEFFPENLSVCINKNCNNNIGERVKTFYNLKIPNIQRGVYEGEIKISLY